MHETLSMTALLRLFYHLQYSFKRKLHYNRLLIHLLPIYRPYVCAYIRSSNSYTLDIGRCYFFWAFVFLPKISGGLACVGEGLVCICVQILVGQYHINNRCIKVGAGQGVEGTWPQNIPPKGRFWQFLTKNPSTKF